VTEERKRPRPDDYFADWKQREALAESMIPVVGQLSRERNVKSYIYGRSLVNQSVLDIMKSHRWVRQMEDNELSEFETTPVLNAVSSLDLGPCHLDIGRLAVAYFDKGAGAGLSIEQYVSQELDYLIGSTHKPVDAPVDVVLYGFGRIGRLMARILIAKTDGGDSLRLRAVVVRRGNAEDDLLKRASLLRRDSVHGVFQGTIRVDEERQSFVANGNEVKVIYADAPEDIDYTAYGIDRCMWLTIPAPGEIGRDCRDTSRPRASRRSF
jgi:glyceraldehyde 3-phosphate dehydrogenase